MNNLEIFNFSLDNPEKYTEKHYEKESIIIPKSKDIENALVKSNKEIIKNITSYEIALNAGNKEMMGWIIDNLMRLLNTK